MKVSILGAGQMGTAFATPLMERGHDVAFWGPEWLDRERLAALRAGERHPDLGEKLPAPVETTLDMEEAVRGADLVALAVTSEGVESVSEEASRRVPPGVPVVVLSKGLLELGGGVVPVTAVVADKFGEGHEVVGVGGPVKAIDLILRDPTRTIFASEDARSAGEAAREVETSYYFPETTDDFVGVGACAALKNCYAIAVGSITGKDAKPNLRALAFGTALSEILTFVLAMGGRPETVAGAAGAGDLYVTCLSGRNGDFGRLLGDGASGEEAREKMAGQTVEGLGTLPPALELADQLGIGEAEIPLLRHLDGVLKGEGVSGVDALQGILKRK